MVPVPVPGEGLARTENLSQEVKGIFPAACGPDEPAGCLWSLKLLAPPSLLTLLLCIQDPISAQIPEPCSSSVVPRALNLVYSLTASAFTCSVPV